MGEIVKENPTKFNVHMGFDNDWKYVHLSVPMSIVFKCRCGDEHDIDMYIGYNGNSVFTDMPCELCGDALELDMKRYECVS